MEHFLIFAWLEDLLRDKKINQREHVILDYLGGQSIPINMAELKKQAWYKTIYRPYSAATKSRDWNHLLNNNFIKLADGLISLNAFKA